MRDSLPAITQITVAAMAAYAFAHFVLGHENPFLAVTVCVTSLGFARDARPRRVLDTALGITFGVLFANVALVLIGRGVWQLAVVLVVVMLMARFFHPSPGFAVSATIQAALVSLIPLSSGAEYTRLIDAVLGGAAAIAATALVPRDARRMARADARTLFAALERATIDLVEALRTGDSGASLHALDELRRTQPLLDNWGTSLDSARSIAAVSPLLRGHRDEIDAQAELRLRMDLVTRNLRVIARRISAVVADGKPRPALADVLAGIESSIVELGLSFDRPALRRQAEQTCILATVRLDPARLVPNGSVGEVMIVMQCRPLVVDLLVATGVDADAARGMLPKVG
ncbi:FUSC family protein [Pseudoclavibacter endophyticus]|uniref:FUSC family protein n=1 Tax=Pseudoclavibacter endophyticus TaxID=1778590 RepID=UPI001662DCDE|nr:FUSC family protein [Pseudoclavibacter endophyticus]GGA62930.1 FUSC family protein [Pseudoclavibacter endophyticus]